MVNKYSTSYTSFYFFWMWSLAASTSRPNSSRAQMVQCPIVSSSRAATPWALGQAACVVPKETV